MAAQNVRELIPRVRRAVEGPITPEQALSDDQVLALAADAIADIILFTAGSWGHTLVVTGRAAETNVPNEWAVDPELNPEEESVVAAQAALGYFFHTFKDMKTSERIVSEGREWEYNTSANLLRDWIKALQEQRNKALESLQAANPALARYASILAVRDRVAAARLEPWQGVGVGGGMELA